MSSNPRYALLNEQIFAARDATSHEARWIQHDTDAPDGYEALVAPLPPGVRFVRNAGADVDLAHVFVTERSELAKRLGSLRSKLRPDAALWISWPKKSSKISLKTSPKPAPPITQNAWSWTDPSAANVRTTV